METYLNRFGDKSDIESEFQLNRGELNDCHIVAAYYSYEDYSGTACVVFVRDFTLYEVYGSHCSCNGLEGQWSPEIVNVYELRSRLERDTLSRYRTYSTEFSEAILAYLSSPSV